MLNTYLNLKRFDIGPAHGGVNRIAPDTSGYDTARMIGTNLGDKDSWLSKSLPTAWQGVKSLLGGGTSTPNISSGVINKAGNLLQQIV